MNGFYIKQLCVTGLNLAPAEIIFEKGGNLVTGDSDSGKSYLFAVLQFMLGRSSEIKDIPESVGYEDYLMQINTFSDETPYTLHRKINQTTIDIKQCEIKNYFTSIADKKTYITKGGLTRSDNISTFLLGLCGLGDKQLLKNKNKGVKQNLGVKDLIKFTFIAEESIITENSPFYFSRQFMDQIKDQSFLSLLLTGDDFSGIRQIVDDDKRETQIRGKLEFIGTQISEYAKELDQLQDEYKQNEASHDYESVYNTLTSKLKEVVQDAKILTDKKTKRVNERLAIQEKLNYNSDLLTRFDILRSQYLSDSKRLEFVLEAEVLSSQLGDTVCPVCASPLDENHIIHIKETDNFRTAVNEELNKIISKLVDLEGTISSLRFEYKAIQASYEYVNGQILELETRLNEDFSPTIDALKTQLSDFMGFESVKNKIKFITKEISKLFTEKDRLERILEIKDIPDDITLLPYSLLSDLAEYIEARLRKWHFLPSVNVIFDSSYQTFDIVISGKRRKSYGKGKRAISYSACVLGVLDYCLAKQTNFSNLIVLDSPLTTFEEKRNVSVTESISQSVVDSFFTDLSNTPTNAQVIIFDNKEPSTGIVDSLSNLNTIVFTGNNQLGRKGFFP